MFLYQVSPTFFNTRFDFFTWIFMQSGLHQWLLNNKAGCILFDAIFYSLPFVYFLIYKKNERAAAWFAIPWLLFNWLYVQCYTLYPTNSIEGHVQWLLMPLLFLTTRIRSFYYMMHGLRYFFLFFFASAAIWKLRQGGIFNMEEMSGILLFHHKEQLVAAPEHWYSQLIYWLVRHPFLGWLLYAAATLLELVFAVGFFTKKYDRQLIILFVLFIIFDYFLMRIPYFEISPLLLPFLFSKFTEPKVTDLRLS